MLDIDTPHGAARVHLRPAGEERAWLVLGHGAGGGVTSRDLVAAGEAALAQEVSVAFVEQPYRVAGRRSPSPTHMLDTAWVTVVERFRSDLAGGMSLVVGGRSSGARVACRTSEATGAAGVLCLAFPLFPPTRAGGKPPTTRLPELDAVNVPTLVVQGERDPFGMPPGSSLRRVVAVSGDHSLRSDLPAVAAAVRDWLLRLVG
ncbi:MAG TPA: alpha/beta family hydrolase [Gaiellaceae bacterium]